MLCNEILYVLLRRLWVEVDVEFAIAHVPTGYRGCRPRRRARSSSLSAMPPPRRLEARQIPVASWTFPKAKDRGLSIAGLRASGPCVAAEASSSCPLWVKSGKVQNEQISSALPPKADSYRARFQFRG